MVDKFLRIAALASLILFLSCGSKVPVISSIDPKIGVMGDVVTISGKNFGSSRDESYVTFRGIAPTSSSYYAWQDNLIMIRIPELGESGLVYVHSRGRKSNGALFTNSASVPKPVAGEELGLGPIIASISPQSGGVGTLVTITGSNFGRSREGGGVFFSWDYESRVNPYLVKEPELIEVSELELGYVSWTAREIRVYLPDGAVSGNVEVRTPHGTSRPVFFDVTGKPGVKVFSDKRVYTVNYSVDIRVIEAERPNALYLWMPMPVVSPSQRNVNLISRNIDPFVENHRGVSLYKLDNLAKGAAQSIDLSFSVDVYAVETEIRPQAVRQERTPVSAMYTQSSALIPSGEARIKETVDAVIGREQNPYNKAKLIYNWIIGNIKMADTPASNSGEIVNAISRKSADTYTFALLYTAMIRAAGIPCVPVAGALVNRHGNTLRHYWVEFWIDGFGWVPADPAMGAGILDASFVTKENPASYYFGNIDNFRVAFSRGELALSQMENRGRVVSHSQSYSLQNIWEEASGGLESYTSLWTGISVSGIYVQ